MKKVILLGALLFAIGISAQSSCSDLMATVKSEGYGSTYYSYDSDAISKVTFYEVSDDNYNKYYFAIVQFTGSFKEYIYQVGPRTKSNYSYNYRTSAGKAFWKYVQPYNKNLNCAPNL
ncbi:MAG: hypothetical protein CMH46_08775 [Muricauda sp.]|nr:hypothetical protein [Allomuricauda sp.]MAU15617.1 hypothetical protein [Allomuricauda sp.]|tara:strand:- start:980 stop:1333 length:354 start_codon:yes stop_codon:yes gene_type:complete